jgi:uncharacterized surface protein with fasciclin (FAS1) repeats
MPLLLVVDGGHVMSKWIHALMIAAALSACSNQDEPVEPAEEGSSEETAARRAPQEEEIPPLDENNIVSIALKSQDHTTLVAALKAAHYVTGVSNAGPLTVFAPTNAAFDALPAGTVANLLKPENVDQLRKVLQHHVIPSVYTAEGLRDGQNLGMVDGTNITVHVADGKVKIGEATILASVRASNGIVHVVDGVLVPAARH